MIQTILKKAQRDEQTLRNIEGSKLNGISFCKSIEKVKKWSAGVIFKSGKYYLDKDVSSMAINATQKKYNEFVEKVTKCTVNFVLGNMNMKRLFYRYFLYYTIIV